MHYLSLYLGVRKCSRQNICFQEAYILLVERVDKLNILIKCSWIVRALKEIRWWEKPIEWIEKHSFLFCDIDAFLQAVRAEAIEDTYYGK